MKTINLNNVPTVNYELAVEVEAYLKKGQIATATETIKLANKLQQLAISKICNNTENTTITSGVLRSKVLVINDAVSLTVVDGFLKELLEVLHTDKVNNLDSYGFVDWENALCGDKVTSATTSIPKINFEITTHNNERDLQAMLSKMGARRTIVSLLTLIHIFKR